MTGLWMRVNTDIVTDQRTLVLRTSCALSTAAAVGHLIALYARLFENRSDGDIGALPAAVIEEWAGWTGEPGAFDAAFRSGFVTDGVIDGWHEQNGIILDRMRRESARKAQDRARQSAGRPASRPSDVRRTSLAGPSLTVTDTVTTSQPPPTTRAHAREAVGGGDASGPTNGGRPLPDGPMGLIVACNLGLRDNPAVGRGEELTRPIPNTHAGSLQVAIDLLAAVDAAFARRTIYELARSYQPKHARDRISSLAYFDAAVRRLWAEHEAAQGLTGVAAPTATADAAAAFDAVLRLMDQHGGFRFLPPDAVAKLDRPSRRGLRAAGGFRELAESDPSVFAKKRKAFIAAFLDATDDRAPPSPAPGPALGAVAAIRSL
jgi:hypothetical protein